MGVKLQNLIEKKKIEFSHLVGKIIAVDAPNIIMGMLNFSYRNKIYSSSSLMTDRTQRAISHLYGILFRINFYYSKNIFPIFCFDGRDSELKRTITKDYLNDFRFTKKWYLQAIKSGDRDLARQISLGKEFLWPNIISESKQLLGALGIPYIESPASAESQCAQLVKDRIANYSNSQDFDSLLFGCPKVILNLSKSLKRKVQGKWTYKKIEPLTINLTENLERLEIDQFQLVDIGLLVGTDYFSGIKGIGPKTALSLIKKHNSLEKIVSQEKNKYDFNLLTPEIIKKIRKIFLLPEVNNSLGTLYWNPPNNSQVITLLCEDHNLNRDKVENNTEKLVKNYEKCRIFFLNSKNRPSSVQITLDMLI